MRSIPAAGIVRDKPFMEHTVSDFKDTIDINVSSSRLVVYSTF
jgi:hypothetical protein